MKTIVIIPGIGERPRNAVFQATARLFRDNGYKVEFVPVAWSRTTIHDWVAQARQVISAARPDVIFGFSFGAMVAAVAFPDSGARTLVLASPSAYFREDLAQVSDRAVRFLGKRRMKAFSEIGRRETFGRLGGNVTVLYAQNDPPLLKRRAVMAKRLIPVRTRVVVVSKAGHDLGHPEYQRAIARVIGNCAEV